MLRAAAAVALLGALGCGDARPVTPPPGPLCSGCHGDPDREPTALNPALPWAPPVGTRGETLPTQPRVGAHMAHLLDGSLRAALPCTECHVVPTDLAHALAPLQLTWGPLATRGGAAPSFDPTALTCSATYCHGTFRNGNRENAPVWTGGSGQAACGSCHLIPPPSPHPQNAVSACGGCHPGYTSSSVDLDLHVNGKVDFGGTGGGCGSCHGYPPATGAHGVHVGYADDSATAGYGETSTLQDLFPTAAPTTAPKAYFFGCGNCHPLDATKHMDGIVELELFDPAAPAGSLKVRNPPAAAYAKVPGDAYGSCSSVYCHSSGQESPGFYRTTPRWDLAFDPAAKSACTGCHDNPPRYDSGGAGTATANTHLVVADDGWEFGHFAGMPGPWHTSKHGAGPGWPGEDAAPMTCQACHSDTVDAANVRTGGFYYLDTTGNYRIDGPTSDPGRLTSAQWLNGQCSTCHFPGGVDQGTGRVLPLRHVNGARDVVFDPRTALPPSPALAWLPPSPDRPTRPYWVTDAAPGSASLPAGAIYDGSTMSLHLRIASYDPRTKTCSSVACHLDQTQVQWGATPVGWATCMTCHPL